VTEKKKPIPLTYHPPNEWADWPTGDVIRYEDRPPEQQRVLDEKAKAAKRNDGSPT
jgi:hypothetical protein